jgi:thiamine-monophosphate kinase
MRLEDLALYGGEDYELVFTVPAHRSRDMAGRVFRETKTAVTLVGDIVREEEGIVLVGREGTISPLGAGYDHFKMAKGEREG